MPGIIIVCGVSDPDRPCAASRWLLRAIYLLAVWTAALGLLLSSLDSPAKEKKRPSKTVTGAVLDEADTPIAGATVELTDVATGKKRAIYSEADGRYKFADLSPNDDYEVRASYKGTFSEVRKASSFDNREVIVLNLKVSLSPPR